MDTNDFDQRLKNALDGLDAPYDPATWAALEQRLDALPEPVDEAVRPALDQLEAPYDPSTWAALERRLDALPEPVDDAVRPVLESMEAPYQPDHWAALAERLEYNRLLHWRLWTAKTLEAALLVLLLLEFGGVWRQQPSPWWMPPAPVAAPQQPVATLRGAGAGRAAGETQHGSTIRPIAGSTAAVPGWRAPSAVTRTLPQPPVSVWPEMTPQSDRGPVYLDPGADGLGPLYFNIGALLGPLPNLLPVSVTRIKEPIAFNAVPTRVSGATRSPFYANVYGASEQHRIRTEGDDVLRRANGYAGGVLAGYRRGPWTVEAGFGYAHRAYEPKRQIEIYDGNLGQGYWGSALTGVSSDMLTVPVRVMRRVARMGGTSAHVVAGATGQLALQKDYGYRSVYYPGSNPGGPGTTNLPDALPDNRITGRGLAEGGTPAGNLYATADAGLRIEQNLGRRLAAYVEPTYRVGIAGRGDGLKRSNTNTLAVQVGVLARL